MLTKVDAMDFVKQKVVYFFFIHVFLRHIGKKYPDFFKRWTADNITNKRDRQILLMRYTGETRMKFAAIAAELGIDESNLFKYHKRAVETLIYAKV